MNGKSVRKYFICAWNELKIDNMNNPQSYVNPWKIDETGEYLKDFLNINNKKINESNNKQIDCGNLLIDERYNLDDIKNNNLNHIWEYTESEEDADLLVIILRASDKVLEPSALRFFVFGISNPPKKVLYIHISEKGIQYDGYLNNFLYIITNCYFNERDLIEWMNLTVDHRKFADSLDILALKASLLKWGNLEGKTDVLSLEDLIKDLHKEKDLRIARTGTGFRLLCHEKNYCSAFFLGLHRISSYYNMFEHDLNAKKKHGLNRKGEITPLFWEDRKKDILKKQFIDACFDLYYSLCSRYAYPLDGEKFTALLIDDKPEKYFEEILEIFSNYLPFCKILVWNPEKLPEPNINFNESDYISLKDIEKYSSIYNQSINNGRKYIEILTWDITKKKLIPDDNSPRCLFDILSETRCVLIDILFQDVYCKDIESGFGLIRGLTRICHDFSNEIEDGIHNYPLKNNAKTNMQKWFIPKFYVVSRANEFKKVHAAFRNGSEGYTLKERLLALPRVITNDTNSPSKRIISLHRNFRQLYNLPAETIGLIRNIIIPMIPFDQLDTENIIDAHSNRPEIELMAKLIRSLPKTDLHVHPGSCMSPEFLVVASLVMLLRHMPSRKIGENDKFIKLTSAIEILAEFWRGEKDLYLDSECSENEPCRLRFEKAKIITSIKTNASVIRKHILNEIQEGKNSLHDFDNNNETKKTYRKLRSILHKNLGILDHYDDERIKNKLNSTSDSKIFLFGLSFGRQIYEQENTEQKKYHPNIDISIDDILRLFILWLAAKYEKSHFKINYQTNEDDQTKEYDIKLDEWFDKGNIEFSEWNSLHSLFYKKNIKDNQAVSTEDLRQNNWQLDFPTKKNNTISIDINLDQYNINFKAYNKSLLEKSPHEEHNPISSLMSSGTRSTNLHEYLDGCEYSGAEHLQHPFLIHLFAQQTCHFFVRTGVFYAELRCAVSGYENPELGFSFADACACLCNAFSNGQKNIFDLWRYPSKEIEPNDSTKSNWIWKHPFSLQTLHGDISGPIIARHFPCKVSIILTGKRHKSTRILLRETGAGAVWYSRPSKPTITSRNFVDRCMDECRIVGFDLAGEESEHHPKDFRKEYDQVAKLHIPTTVHAGENAPADFVEGAILDLKARRLGHGLSLADDPVLMDRARDERICIELCPVSNFQTNAIHPYQNENHIREYPLRKFMENGNAICINTDNPSVSNTNMVKECFQASYAYGHPGLSLWELLRIFRQGYTHSFLTLSEKRALLEVAEQLLFDIFTRDDVLTFLRIINFLNDHNV